MSDCEHECESEEYASSSVLWNYELDIPIPDFSAFGDGGGGNSSSLISSEPDSHKVCPNAPNINRIKYHHHPSSLPPPLCPDFH